MIRIIALALLFTALGPMRGQTGAPDPLFETLPFAEWLTGGQQTQFKWSTHIAPPHLSSHQRLLTQVEARLDGVELARRRGTGELLVMVQITDADRRVFQAHESVNLEKIEEGIRKSDIVYSQPVFLRPGDYQVAVALFITSTKEHSVRRESVHVAPLKADPLPEAWNALPPVEFIGAAESPDSWYLPAVEGQLHLPVKTQRPLRIEAVVNLTPSERAAGSFRVQDRNLSALLPDLKTLAQLGGRNITLNVSLLDLSRRKITFRQEDVQELDWPRMKNALAETTPGSIDVKSLGDRQHSAAFFVSEVERRLAGQDRPIVIVLSGPVEFDSGQELRPIAPNAQGRVIYIRQHAFVRTALPTPSFPPVMSSRGAPVQMEAQRSHILVDQLEPTLKPLNPELFDPRTPDEFRKVLAELIHEAAHW